MFKIRMSATLENIDVVDDTLANYLSGWDLPVDIFAVRILLREALLNAVTHGSGMDSRKTVRLEIRMNTDGIDMEVCDSGSGFPWWNLKEYTFNLDEGGRGLALMKIYSDNMEFNETGNTIILRKRYKVDEPISR
ncbi:MAG: ATP-binding protein [Sedimentisphaerales bacterium]|nr:ATP-binding protein [Sedimentisphaerales bacterium]